MIRQRCSLFVLLLCLCSPLAAQGGLLSLLKKVGNKLDSMSVKGVDRRYIDAPERPWQFIVKGNINQTILSMRTHGDIEGVPYSAKPQLKTTPSQYLGFWVGYRGYGIGYTANVGGDKGGYLTFGATGGAYGVNVRIHNFENKTPNFNLNSDIIPEDGKESWNKVVLIDPIRIRTVMADGYYMFNGKKFSYSAAYDQSVIQKRSAGSLMAGFMYNYTRIDYSSDVNGDMVFLMGGVGKVKLWQGSAGVGYAYNWVPVRGLLVNIMAMPMLTFVNKLRAYGYSTNIPQLMEEPEFWDPNISNEAWDQWFYGKLRITPQGHETYNSGLTVSFDARMSLTYNIGPCFLNVYGQFNNIRFSHSSSKGYLNDWFIYTSLGVRM